MASAHPAINGTATAAPSNKSKSRGQLKRLKKKAKGQHSDAADQAQQAPDRPLERPPSAVRPDPVASLCPHPADFGFALVQDSDVVAAANIKLEGDNGEQAVPSGFADVFAHFQLPGEPVKASLSAPRHPPSPKPSADSRAHSQSESGQAPAGDEKGQVIYSDDEMPSEDDEHPAAEMSKRKQRKANRLSVAELKRLVKKPEVVDWVDVSANDPKLLIEIKSHRNTIPIPQHWSQKRDYLQGKRGIEKPAFQLPSQSSSPKFGRASWRPSLTNVCTDLVQASLPIPASLRSATRSRRRRTRNRSSKRPASASSQRWARSTSTTRNSTTPSSSTRQSPR
jgi:splicing factor 3B subunit 2